MHEPGDVWATVICDCGHEFDVSLVGHDPETMQFSCPACGKVDRFTAEQAAHITAEYEGAKSSINKAIAEAAASFKRRGK